MRKFATLLSVLLITATTFAGTVDLTGQTEAYTATNGQTLTGALETIVTIADGATVTFSNLIIATDKDGYFICEGDATIILVGENNINRPSYTTGIQVGPEGKTLTIKGDGSLNTSGIGITTNAFVGGNVIVEGGTINASFIGTGTAMSGSIAIGDITLKGGKITAYIGRGKAMGWTASTACGAITITDGIELIDAAYIGGDYYPYTGTIKYCHDNEVLQGEDVANYFTIINGVGDNSRVIYPKDDTRYNVTIAEGITGGTITPSEISALYLQPVILTITPNSDSELKSVTVTDANGNVIAEGVDVKKYRQPKCAVTVNALFDKKPVVLNDGMLTINSGFTATEVKAYSGNTNVKSVQCTQGVVFPADCSELFAGFTEVTTINLANANISAVTNTSGMFQNDSKLSKIIVDYDNWNLPAATQSTDMFSGCSALEGMLGTKFHGNEDADSATAKYAIIDGKNNQPGYLSFIYECAIGGNDEASAITIVPDEKTKYLSSLSGWYKITEDISLGSVNIPENAHLIISDGVTVHVSKVSGGYCSAIVSQAIVYSLTTHGGANQTGTFVADNVDATPCGGKFIIGGGRIEVANFAQTVFTNIAEGFTYYYLDDYGNRVDITENFGSSLAEGKLLLPLITYSVTSNVTTPHYTLSTETAVVDETVYIYAENGGYIFGNIKVTDAAGNSVEVIKDNDYQVHFTMPASAVTVNAQTRKSLSHSDISVADIQSQTYTGSTLNPTIVVSDGQNTLVEGTDYTINHFSNTYINADTYYLTLTGIGSYCDVVGYIEYVIEPKSVVSDDIATVPAVYNGSAQEPVVKDGETKLVVNSDYTFGTLSGNLTDAGEYTVTIYGQNNYTGSAEKTFTITPAVLENAVVTLAETQFTYDGTAKTPAITSVNDGENDLDTADYTMSYINNINAGTATVMITIGGNYCCTATFTIASKTVNNPTIVLSDTTFEFNGEEQKPSVTVSDGGTVIPAGEYIVTYTDNTNAGTATVNISGKTGGNYVVSGSATFTITTKTIESIAITLSEQSFVYDGTAKMPTLTVSDGEKVIAESEYTVTYEDNINAGTAKVSISNKGGNYSFSGMAFFAITKADATLVKAPEAIANLVENSNAQNLITAGIAENGTLLYKLGADGKYSEDLPYAKDAGTYTIYYKVEGNENYNDIADASIVVTIAAQQSTAVNESAACAVNIYAYGNTIVVENATDEISVYDSMGNLICRDAINRVRVEITINTTGVYIVKTCNVVKRVMVY
ncbi:MAG: BspA family leucine-rich repeat surface protein [Salinivirgaceae bacterium]|nr:BspA family leucine-rich repeat surface protein [Salinivirgaceae bacterium]